MNIDWAVACRYAESDGVVATMVGAGIDVSFFQEFPAPIGVMMAVRLAAPPDELAPGQVHPLRCRVLDEDQAPITDLDGDEIPPLEIAIGTQVPIQQIVPGWLVQPLVAFGVQWLAKEPMTYTIALSIDNEDPLRVPFHAVRPPQPSA